MWSNSIELSVAIEEAHRKLCAGESSPVHAHAEARLFATAVKLLAIKLEHAKMTGRLKEGSATLPEFGVVKK